MLKGHLVPRLSGEGELSGDRLDPAKLEQSIREQLIAQRQSVQSKATHIEAPQNTLDGARVFSNRRNLLRSLGKVRSAAELGVDNGDFSRFILDALDPVELVLIDSWQQARYADKEQKIRARFADDARVSICKGMSTEALAAFPDHHFDFIYIDTNHTYATTIEELRISGRKVAPGKWISGHDFCSGNIVGGVVYGVVPAVTEFLSEGGGSLQGISLEPSGHFSFLIKTPEVAEDQGDQSAGASSNPSN